MDGDSRNCRACSRTPTVLVAVAHPALRTLTWELLGRDHGCWDVRKLDDRALLGPAVQASPPDLLIIDASDFPRCCREVLGDYPPERVVVIGPEPDEAYQRSARRAGAGAWLASDRVAEDLTKGMRTALRYVHSSEGRHECAQLPQHAVAFPAAATRR